MTTVDTWLLPVEAGAAADPALLEVVGALDSARIAAIGLGEDRDRAVTARVAARIELGRRLGVAPSDVPLRTDGPPTVGGSDVGVGWSHSGRWVALALCAGRQVGIDIEHVPERIRMRALLEIGVASLEEFVGLEAASKATKCVFGGRPPPGVTVRRLAAPAGYIAAVAAPGNDWTHELHMRSPLSGFRKPSAPVAARPRARYACPTPFPHMDWRAR